MASRTEDPGTIIKNARKERGWSQERLAKEVGISQPAIRKIEAGSTTKSRYLSKVADVLGINLRLLDSTLSENVNYSSKVVAVQGNHPSPTIPGAELVGDRDLPVHGTAQGGRGAVIVTTDPVDWVSRPQPLARVKDGYGIIISESSMEPEFEPGDIALVHPHKPPTPGRTCVFYAQRPDGTVEACIKRLRKETVDEWYVTQFNPPKGKKRDYVLKKSEWQKCHVTVGSYKGR